ncbi:MAG: hypothetical protein ALECFALPRED_000541, partial [Alectoria fallacina]
SLGSRKSIKPKGSNAIHNYVSKRNESTTSDITMVKDGAEQAARTSKNYTLKDSNASYQDQNKSQVSRRFDVNNNKV